MPGLAADQSRHGKPVGNVRRRNWACGRLGCLVLGAARAGREKARAAGCGGGAKRAHARQCQCSVVRRGGGRLKGRIKMTRFNRHRKKTRPASQALTHNNSPSMRMRGRTSQLAVVMWRTRHAPCSCGVLWRTTPCVSVQESESPSRRGGFDSVSQGRSLLKKVRVAAVDVGGAREARGARVPFTICDDDTLSKWLFPAGHTHSMFTPTHSLACCFCSVVRFTAHTTTAA